MRSLVSSFAVSLLAAPVLLLGCSKTNNIDTDNSTNNIYQKTIGAKGGVVGDAKGFGVYIPGDALAEDVDVVLREPEPDEYPALPANAVGGVYSFEPHGTELAAPGTFHLPFPDPRPMYMQAYRAEPGGAFMPVSGMNDASGSSFTFMSSRFAFFVITDPMARGPGSGGKDECMRTEGLPEGLANAQPGGTVGDSTGAAVSPPISSGYAVRDVVSGENTRLQLVFGQLTESCVYGVQAGGSDDLLLDPIGAKNSSNFVVSLVLAATTPGTPDDLEPGTTYPRIDSADQARSALVVLEESCKAHPEPAEQTSTSVTVTAIDDLGVHGVLQTEHEASGASMTVDFDLEYCPLPAPTARCCP